MGGGAADGTPPPDTELDMWQCSEDGFYDVHRADVRPPGKCVASRSNGCGASIASPIPLTCEPQMP